MKLNKKKIGKGNRKKAETVEAGENELKMEFMQVCKSLSYKLGTASECINAVRKLYACTDRTAAPHVTNMILLSPHKFNEFSVMLRLSI